MAETFDYDVFLSYSSKDRGVVDSLAERLRDSGLRVWLDHWVIRPGDAISLKIERGVEKSRVLLMCMSKAYFASEWTRLEHHSLLFRDPTNKDRRFIPVLIENCDRPHTVAQFAYVDWREPSGEAYDALLKACRPDPSKRKREPGRARRGKRASRGSQVVRSLEGHGAGVEAVAVMPDGRLAISGSLDGTLKIWDLEQPALLATLEGHGDQVLALAVTPDGRRAVSGSHDTTLKVWDLEQGALLATLEGHGGWVGALAVTPDGRRAVSGSQDRTLKVWDLEQGTLLATLEGHAGVIIALAMMPDGRRAVSGSYDNTLKVWDLEQGALLATLEGHVGWVRAVAVTPDGRRAVSGSYDHTLKIWDLPPPNVAVDFETTRYTNAKVALVGESGAGKTGLAIRLVENRWRKTDSTHGMNVCQLELRGMMLGKLCRSSARPGCGTLPASRITA